MKDKTQVLYIHGGMTFWKKKDYFNYIRKGKIKFFVGERPSWHGSIFDKELGKNFEIIRPRMPLIEDAKYEYWKTHFEKYFPFLRDNLILIGESLGATFLAKYLSENKFPKKLLSVYLVAVPFDDTLPTEDLAGGFRLKSDLSLIEKNCSRITFMFSKNDDVVPVSHAKKYRKKLKNVKIIVYNHIKGHFQIPDFPQIVKMIKSDVRRLK